jgi:hypothetical protein
MAISTTIPLLRHFQYRLLSSHLSWCTDVSPRDVSPTECFADGLFRRRDASPICIFWYIERTCTVILSTYGLTIYSCSPMQQIVSVVPTAIIHVHSSLNLRTRQIGKLAGVYSFNLD